MIISIAFLTSYYWPPLPLDTPLTVPWPNDDYNITIFCKDEQEQQRAMKRLEVANRMRWHDAKTDPPEDSRDVIVYRDGIGSVMGFFDHEIHKRWLDANTCAFLDDVTHWMEKPEDPEKTEEGDPE